MAFIIKEPPEFTQEVTQWNRETLADGVEMAKELEKLLNNDVYLRSWIERIKAPKHVSLTASGWSSTAPYTQTVSVVGVLASDMPVISLFLPDGLSAATVKAQKKAYGMVDRAETGEGQITFYCYNKKPAVDFQVVAKGV